MKKTLLTVALLCGCIAPAYAGTNVPNGYVNPIDRPRPQSPFVESTCTIEGNIVFISLDMTTHGAQAVIPGKTYTGGADPYTYQPKTGVTVVSTSGIWFVADPGSGQTSRLMVSGQAEPMSCTPFHAVTYSFTPSW